MNKNFLSAAAFAAAMGAAIAARAETVTAEPDAFLEYVEATGTQYIDTGVNAETGLKARLDWSISSGTQNDSSFLDAKVGNNRRFMMVHSYQKRPYLACGDGDSAKRMPGRQFPFDTRFEYVSDVTDGTAVQVYLNASNLIASADQATSAAAMPANGVITASDMNDLTLYLFAGNFDRTAKYYGKAKLYELKILKKNASTGELDLVRHYLPCLKDGRAGLYDKVNGTVSFSYGSGEFVAGSVVPPPAALVEWVESDGSSISVDTRVVGKSGLRSEVDFTVKASNASGSNSDNCVLGSRGNGTDYRYYLAYFYENEFVYGNGKLFATGYNGGVNTVASTVGTRYLVQSEIGTNVQTVVVNGTEIHKDGVDSDYAYFSTGFMMHLFCNNHAGSRKTYAKARLYSAKIWDGDELLRDFVPCVATNGVAGLYDAVSERVFFPYSTAFDLATQVGAITNVLREAAAPKKRLEYVESDGVADYVDLGVLGNVGVETELTMAWSGNAVPKERGAIGSRIPNGSGDFKRFYPYATYKDIPYAHAYVYNTSYYTARDSSDQTIPAELGKVYKIVSRFDKGAQSMTVSKLENGAWAYLGSRATDNGNLINTDLPMYLFAVNEEYVAKWFVKARVYGLKLRVKQQDGSYALVRDFIPVRDPVTGGAALWDRVSEAYFRNGGKYLLSGGGAERDMKAPFVMTIK